MPSPPEAESPQRRIWIDGAMVPWEQATVHVLSHSHQRGSLIFDYMSVHEAARGPAIFRLREHVERFQHSAELLSMPLEQGREALEAAVVEAVRANPGATAVKISAYFAAVEVDVVPRNTHVTLAVAAYDPIVDVMGLGDMKVSEPIPLKLWLEKERRNRRADILPPQAKVAANYASPMTAKWAAKKAGYDEILLIDEGGFVAEGPTTNFFLVDREGTLFTPPDVTVLHGVTRSTVIEIAEHAGRKVREEPFRPEAIFQASEAFLTGTTAGVLPIASVDDRELAVPAPGPVSRELRERFLAITAGKDPAFDHWLSYVGEA